MPAVPLILLGAAFSLAWAYALGLICLRRLPAPWEVALAVGAAAESLVVFFVLTAGVGSIGVYLALGVASMAAAWTFRVPAFKDPPAPPAPRPARLVFAAILAVYAVFYFVHALAPEIESDGVGYHLGLTSLYVRTGALPGRVGFYEMVPQGMEMLFTVAFAIGRHSAAKLVHFAFLLATVPLLLRIGRRLRLPDLASLAAAGIYFCAPVTGVSGTCSYNDAAAVFFSLVVFYLLLVWRDRHNDRYLLAAGLAAGFCYAIKFTGIIVLPLAILAALLAARRLRPAFWLAAGVVLIAPWMIRDAVLSGNPLAPLFNRWFPNPYFHPAMEEYLGQTLRSYGVIHRWRIPIELAVGGQLQGIYGPLFFALPLSLLALRRAAGRWCWLAAAALAVPWFWNIGARFLMPSFAFAALAFAMAVPRAAALACLLFQSVACWPQVIALYQPGDIWRLRGFPWDAALRLRSEETYRLRHVDEYPATRLVQQNTPPGARVFALCSVASAYTDRDTLQYWHSAQADRLLDTLRVAGPWSDSPLYDVTAAWPPQLLRALRFRLTRPHGGEWCLHEVRVFRGGDRIPNSRRWTLSGWPNPWDIAYSFDDNLATRWRTWTPMRPGMYVQVDFDRPRLLDSATLVSHTPAYDVPMEFYGLDPQGRWRSFGPGRAVKRPWQDLRREAMHGVRREGFQYLLAPVDADGLGFLGAAILEHPQDWDVEPIAEINERVLFRIK